MLSSLLFLAVSLSFLLHRVRLIIPTPEDQQENSEALVHDVTEFWRPGLLPTLLNVRRVFPELGEMRVSRRTHGTIAAKCFTCTVLFNPRNNFLRVVLLLAHSTDRRNKAQSS